MTPDMRAASTDKTTSHNTDNNAPSYTMSDAKLSSVEPCSTKDEVKAVHKPKKSLPDRYSFSIEWKHVTNLMQPNRAVQRWNGTLVLVDGTAKERTVGAITCYKIINIYTLGSDAEAICDSCSEDLAAFVREVIRTGLHCSSIIKDGIRNKIGHLDLPTNCILFVEDMKVDEEFRGFGLGLFLANDVRFRLSDTFPLIVLQVARRTEGGSNTEASSVVANKLRSHFRTLGFRDLGSSYVALYGELVSWS